MASSHCTSLENSLCQSNFCQPCISSDDCSHFLKETHCLLGKCVECLSDNDRPDQKPICNLQENKCYGCINSDQCSNKNPLKP